MRRKLLALLSVLLLFSLVSLVRADDWISGQVNTAPSTITYSGTVYVQFGFSVAESNGSASGNVTCLVPYVLVISSINQIVLGANQNLTGNIVANGTLPLADFLVSGFANPTNSTGLNIEGVLVWVWTLLGSLGNVMVSELQYFCQNSLNIAVPTAVMNSILLTVLALVWWYVRRLPWFISVLMFFVCIGLASSLVTTMGLM